MRKVLGMSLVPAMAVSHALVLAYR